VDQRNEPSRRDFPRESPGAEAEALLIRLAKQGDVQAFEQLYRRHVGRVHALGLRLTADPGEAEILTQDVFVRAWQKLRTFQGKGAFGGWLRRITVNLATENHRAAARRNRWLRPFGEPAGRGGTDGEQLGRTGTGTPRREGGPGDPAAAGLKLDLERAIAALPTGARQAFVLHDVEGFRCREIAEMTDRAVGTVKSQLHRARQLLRRALDGEIRSRKAIGS